MHTTTIEPGAFSRQRAFVTLGVLSIIWGTSFILIKKSLSAFQPTQVACLRMSISALAFVPMLWFARRRMDWSKLPWLLVVGLCSSAIPAFLFANAQQHISSAMAGILNSLTPLFTFVLGILFFKSSFQIMRLVGVLFGLAGAVFLIMLGNRSGLEGGIGWGMLIVVAAVCYAIGTNVIGQKLQDLDSLLISSASFGLVGVPLMIYLFVGTDFVHRMQVVPQAWPALGYVTILAMVGTVAASIVFFHLIQKTSPIFGSTVAYLMPLISLLWGIADGEPIGWMHLGGMGLILTGVYLSRR